MGVIKNIQFFIHRHYEGIKLALLAFIAVLAIMTFFNINRAVQQILEDNDRSHARTQQYIRCIAEAILVPLAERDQINFGDCSNTKTDAEANPKPQSSAPESNQPGQTSSAPAPRAQDNVATEPRPPVAPQTQSAPQQPATTPTPAAPTPEQPRGLVPSVLDGVTGTVNGLRGVLGL